MKYRSIKFILLILNLTMWLSSCLYCMVEAGAVYETHSDFANGINEYNSKNDGYVNTFVSFDFDSKDIVSDKYYEIATVAKGNRLTDKVLCYDKYTDGLHVAIVLYFRHIDEGNREIDYAFQVVCQYASSYPQFTFDENDELKIDIIDENKIIYPYETYKNRYYNPNEIQYNYIGTYELKVNGSCVMEISVAAFEEEMTQEKIDEILKLLMDNIVIINTEGVKE